MKKISLILIAIFIATATFTSARPAKPISLHMRNAKASVHKKKAKKPIFYYWYSVTPNIATGPVTNSDCMFISYSASPGNTPICSGNTPLFYCVIALSGSQVNTTTHVITGSQTPGLIYAYKGFND